MAPPGTFPEGCCGGRFSGGCILWPACLYIPGPEPYRWLLELSPIGCDDTPSIQLPTSTPLRETLLDAGNPSDVEAPAQSAGALSRLDERLERMEKRQLEQAHRGRVYFTYALLTLIAILYKLQNPERYGIYSTFNVYCALILYMTMNKNSDRAIRGVMIFIGLSFLIAALIYFITQVIKPIFDGTFGLLSWLGWKVTQGSQPVACLLSPETEAECQTAVAAAGLSEGGCGFPFAGAYGSGRGCYTYASGTYEGCGYWSTSGDPTAPVTGSAGGGIRVRVCAAP